MLRLPARSMREPIGCFVRQPRSEGAKAGRIHFDGTRRSDRPGFVMYIPAMVDQPGLELEDKGYAGIENEARTATPA